jgi:tRNA threonylcarbamoyladenosine biosynthesis protein TsaE
MPDKLLTLTSTSPEATRDIGAAFAKVLAPGDIIGLTGELGAGKTVLVQGLARELNATTEATSPTFVLMHIYSGRIRLVHADLYRLSSAQADELGLTDYLVDAAGVIEWAERLSGIELDLKIHLTLVPEAVNERRIEVTALSTRGDTLLQAIS